MKKYFYFSYHGNKRGEYKHFAPLIKTTKFNKFIEPFCGSCSTTFRLMQELEDDNIKYYCNDNDQDLIKFFDYVKKQNYSEFINYFNKKRKITKQEYEELKKEKTMLNYLFFRTFYAMREGLFPTKKKFIDRKYTDYELLDFNIKKVNFSNMDYSEIFKKYQDDKHALFFIDPPYFSSFNQTYISFKNNKEYDENKILVDNTQMYVDILNLLKSNCKVLLIINDCAITRELYKDFIKNDYKKIYQYSKKKTQHILVSNF